MKLSRRAVDSLRLSMGLFAMPSGMSVKPSAFVLADALAFVPPYFLDSANSCSDTMMSVV